MMADKYRHHKVLAGSKKNWKKPALTILTRDSRPLEVLNTCKLPINGVVIAGSPGFQNDMCGQMSDCRRCFGLDVS